MKEAAFILWAIQAGCWFLASSFIKDDAKITRAWVAGWASLVISIVLSRVAK